jgi:hypothetical protein
MAQAFGPARTEDDSVQALGLILDAWEQGLSRGVAPELMAYAAMFAALSDLVAAYGEDAVAILAAGLGPRIKSGEFSWTCSQH